MARSKIDKVMLSVKEIEERLNQLEINKIDGDDIMEKVGDIADIVNDFVKKVVMLEQKVLFFSDLVQNLAGREIDFDDGVDENDTNNYLHH